MSRPSTTLSSSHPSDCDTEAGTFADESAPQRDYNKEVASVQRAMGLQSDDWLFSQIKAAVTAVARKFDVMSCSVPLNVGEIAKSEQFQFSVRLKKAAWWVRDRVPVRSNHQSLRKPIYRLLEIRRSEVARREARFRAGNASATTLPDFDLLLELEELGSQKRYP
ncbi:hypothetical protein BKA70DRAFT_1438765 [Coprinopsis sp. MPI-PUGE-AT-0042]|nr:hypothetical protein BKA70DRAFT_1438765 [Coprinopsis sp. MPI-PUGE-AT-0042]